MSGTDDELLIGAKSIFGARTRRGLVELTVGETSVTIPPVKAREVASFLLEAASAAEGDEILMLTLEKAGLSQTRAAQVLMAVRVEREIVERRAREEARRSFAFDRLDLDAPPRSD